MARRRTVQTLSIADIQRMLAERRGDLAQLKRERRELSKRLTEVDRQIRALRDGRAGRGAGKAAPAGGAGPGPGRGRGRGRRPGRRGRGGQSLANVIEQVLREAGGPLRVQEILQRVQQAGYRSSSRNFRVIVNQTLIKDDRFAAAGRGVYQLNQSADGNA